MDVSLMYQFSFSFCNAHLDLQYWKLNTVMLDAAYVSNDKIKLDELEDLFIFACENGCSTK